MGIVVTDGKQLVEAVEGYVSKVMALPPEVKIVGLGQVRGGPLRVWLQADNDDRLFSSNIEGQDVRREFFEHGDVLLLHEAGQE